MTFADFLAGYWWLVFPLFGMAWGFADMVLGQRRSRAAMDLIKSYVDQGKEPPAELLKQASNPDAIDTSTGPNDGAWTFVVFAALTAAAGAAYYFMQGEDWAHWLLVGAIFAGVMALGALLISVLGRKR